MGNGEGEDLVGCGDTEWCDDCDTNEVKDKPGQTGPKVHAKNDLGRCDFYEGPDQKVVKITRQSKD